MIAIKRLQSIMWILIVAAGALAAYLISLRVATERNAVHDMIDQIRWTRAEIRYLEGEFGARANMRQLAAWNHSDFKLYVPAPAQYLPNERELAHLDRMAPVADGYAPPPVMTAMVTQAAQPQPSPATSPAASKPAEATTPTRPASSEFALIRTASAAEPKPAAAGKAEPRVKTAAADRFIKPAAQPDPDARKAARLALLDQKLLGGESKVR